MNYKYKAQLNNQSGLTRLYRKQADEIYSVTPIFVNTCFCLPSV